jgi:CheY-like chemotaxis protein
MAAQRVLVVDDNPDMCAALARLLAHLGYEVETARDGNQALQVHRGRAVAVVITDIFMPGKEGMETIQAFKAEWPALRVIAMSGGGDVARGSYLDAALHVGADAVLQKPFSLASLRAALGPVG